jgi:hypothetical protein
MISGHAAWQHKYELFSEIVIYLTPGVIQVWGTGEG